jgi:carbamoyl-phosphate synthase large subunit
MERAGLWEKYGVKVLGTPIKTLETSEDRGMKFLDLLTNHY